MISSYFQGGLGNQLFQIAVAVALAADNKVEAVFDSANHDLPKQGRKCKNYLETIFRNVNFSSGLQLSTAYHEPQYSYKEIKYTPGMCLIGYFQSEKYFIQHADLIRRLFSIDDKTKAAIEEKYGEALKKETVAVHVRRGDYLKYSDTHPPCTIEYYQTAMSQFPEDSTYLFFSDDIAWCKENFKQNNIIFVEDEEDIYDFYLISMCKSIIISNSSFSWWAAWLNDDGHKSVITPKRWFGPTVNHDTKDLIPARWKKI
jgi:hypothetical protein